MGFKVIETEEELRSAHSAGLLWFKGANDPEYAEEYLTIDELVSDWHRRAEHAAWESYILVEDE